MARSRPTNLLTHFGGTSNISLTNIIQNNNNNDNINIGDPEHISEFTILSLNVQSLHTKIDQIKILIYDLAQQILYFNIIYAQETWLSLKMLTLI